MKRRSLYHWYHHPIFLLFLILFFFFLVTSTYRSFSKRQKASQEHDRIEKEYQELKEKKSDLELNIQHLETPRGREEAFRELFNVIKEGEQVIRVIEEE